MKPEADAIYDSYDDVFFEKGPEGLPPIGLDIVAGSFFGQMRSGGLLAYFDSPWSCLSDQVVPAFTRMGLAKYALITSEMFDKWQTSDSTDRIAVDAIEEVFWQHYWRNTDGDSGILDEAILRHEGRRTSLRSS